MTVHAPEWTGSEPPARRKRAPRWLLVVLLVVIALLAIAVIVDRVAVAYADNTIATEIQKQGFNAKPDVKIKGFPFLTQAISRDFKHVSLRARGVKEGPLTISRLDADVRGVRLESSYQKGTIGSLDGTAVVTFADLAAAAGQSDLSLSAAGPDMVRAKVDLGIVEGTATARVTKVGNQIQVHGISVEGFPLSELGDELDFSVPVPALPLGLTFQSLRISSEGVMLRITGSRVRFG
ncbi:LmeA family phospholipid-binding protein [Actinomadura scrupuli]|uniref:LmeA family phospholipid-binding protein n=1 Tax=Actinomadura scrupuli TaxID=559629 RepID=UPI003D9840A1